MASIWAELKRRNVVRVAVACAVVGWLLIEVAATILPILEVPEWLLQTFTVFVILGFPLALILSWIFDLTPQSLERTDTGSQPEIVFVVADNYVLESSDSPDACRLDCRLLVEVHSGLGFRE